MQVTKPSLLSRKWGKIKDFKHTRRTQTSQNNKLIKSTDQINICLLQMWFSYTHNPHIKQASSVID